MVLSPRNASSIMPEYGEGGISGELLGQRSKLVRDDVFKILKTHFPNKNLSERLNIIGVGGISRFEDLWHFWKQGGKVVQIYTSLIYQGPKILFDIIQRIEEHLNYYQFSHLEELLLHIEKKEITLISRTKALF